MGYSNMGLKRGENDPTFAAHEDYYDSIETENSDDEDSGYDIAVIENVPEYKEKTVEARLPKSWRLMSARLDPRCLGLGAARPGSASFHWCWQIYTWVVSRKKLATSHQKTMLSLRQFIKDLDLLVAVFWGPTQVEN